MIGRRVDIPFVKSLLEACARLDGCRSVAAAGRENCVAVEALKNCIVGQMRNREWACGKGVSRAGRWDRLVRVRSSKAP